MGTKSRLLAAITAALTLSICAAGAGAAHAAVVTDSFTGTNGTLLENHVGETGATWTSHAAYPSHLALLNGRVWGSEWGLYFPSGIPSTNEYDVSADLTVMSNAGAVGVVGRSLTSGSDSLYMGRYNAATAQWELVKCISTGCTNLATAPETLTVGSTYAVKLQIRNAAKTLFVNGVQRASSTDNTITQVGRAGIRVGPGVTTSSGGYHLDNFSVTEPTADTTITSGPSGRTNNTTPSFSFTSTPSGGTFECKLDGPAGAIGTWGACTSPKSYTLSAGVYTFNVRATVGGVTDSTPATRSFTVDTTPPDTTIDSGPTGTITTNSANFGFSSEAGATFQCKLDGPGATTGTYGSCTSPKAYSSLANGSYTFSVRATDTAGNVDASPATRAFTVNVSAGCSLNLASLSVSGCTLLNSDNSTVLDPNALWGNIECVSDSRHQQIATGGDTHPMGNGAAQGDTAYRRLTVLDGDNFSGERCELGINEWRPGFTPTFHLYNEGDHQITFFSMRLPSNLPINPPSWQVVMQMKQTQPADNDGTPVLSLNVEGGEWKVFQSDSILKTSGGRWLWTTPAANGIWTRFAWDVTYSQDSTVGKIKVYADLNNDGDALDTGEQSQQLTTYTLKRETAPEPPDDPLVEGASIPSHLRVGVYHDIPISCPTPNGCSVETDNVQVYQGP